MFPATNRTQSSTQQLTLSQALGSSLQPVLSSEYLLSGVDRQNDVEMTLKRRFDQSLGTIYIETNGTSSFGKPLDGDFAMFQFSLVDLAYDELKAAEKEGLEADELEILEREVKKKERS